MLDIKTMSFKQHMQTAKARGIPFKFTFEQWCAWWEDNLGPGWIGKRGRNKGQYVMARNRDKGPYAVWNVKCKTAIVNVSEANTGRRKHALTRLTAKEAVEIFLSKGTNDELCQKYKVSRGIIERIKDRTTWRPFTEKLTPPKRGRGTQGESRWSAKLTNDDVINVRNSKESTSALAKLYGVQYMAIYNIRIKRTWKHLL